MKTIDASIQQQLLIELTEILLDRLKEAQDFGELKQAVMGYVRALGGDEHFCLDEDFGLDPSERLSESN
jgi:hypothetical protein